MRPAASAHDLTLWLDADVPVRMFFAGQRWEVTDTPTPLPVRNAPIGARGGAWRFQGTNPGGESLVFDVYEQAGHWHVHRAYA
ncbi:hypothetical protein AB3M83_04320 [Microbacterium sp. 179-B 1A2 NHS]|uniref:hypothetical protein n=1 Tax=Microbacterium sp. 179-B 1A2 NHS TaxID=3142383 RepID=UPI00399F697C